MTEHISLAASLATILTALATFLTVWEMRRGRIQSNMPAVAIIPPQYGIHVKLDADLHLSFELKEMLPDLVAKQDPSYKSIAGTVVSFDESLDSQWKRVNPKIAVLFYLANFSKNVAYDVRIHYNATHRHLSKIVESSWYFRREKATISKVVRRRIWQKSQSSSLFTKDMAVNLQNHRSIHLPALYPDEMRSDTADPMSVGRKFPVALPIGFLIELFFCDLATILSDPPTLQFDVSYADTTGRRHKQSLRFYAQMVYGQGPRVDPHSMAGPGGEVAFWLRLKSSG